MMSDKMQRDVLRALVSAGYSRDITLRVAPCDVPGRVRYVIELDGSAIGTVGADSAKIAMSRKFDRFWAAYPRKAEPGKAREAFFNIAPDDALMDEIMAGLVAAKVSPQWRESTRFIPYPHRWLARRGWCETYEKAPDKRGSFDTDDFFEAALKKSYEGDGNGS